MERGEEFNGGQPDFRTLMVEQMQRLQDELAATQERVIQLTRGRERDPIQDNQAPTQVLKEPRMQTPPLYSGKQGDARDFILQLDNIFSVQTARYSLDTVKIRFAISLLTGNALKWANAMLLRKKFHEGRPEEIFIPAPKNWDDFQLEFLKMFDDPD
jgi:hypothetical protein